jgi:hypothetical protein
MFNEEQLKKLNRINSVNNAANTLESYTPQDLQGLHFGYLSRFYGAPITTLDLPEDICRKVYNYALDLLHAELRSYTIDIKGPSDV